MSLWFFVANSLSLFLFSILSILLPVTPSNSLSLSPPQSVSLSVVLFSHRPLQFPFRVNKFMHAKVQSVKCTTGLQYAMRIASAFRLCAPCVLCYVMVWHVASCLHQIFVSCTQICSSHEIFLQHNKFSQHHPSNACISVECIVLAGFGHASYAFCNENECVRFLSTFKSIRICEINACC